MREWIGRGGRKKQGTEELEGMEGWDEVSQGKRIRWSGNRQGRLGWKTEPERRPV